MPTEPFVLEVKGEYLIPLLWASLHSRMRAMFALAMCVASSIHCVSSMDGGGSGSIISITSLCYGGGGSVSMRV